MNPTTLADIVHHASSPRQEKQMARAELEQMYAPTRSDFPMTGDVAQLIHGIKHAWEAQDPAIMDKGLGLTYGGQPGGSNNVVNALVGTGTRGNMNRGPGQAKALFVDERGVFGTVPGGFKRKPSMFGPEHLRLMVENTPLINAIILRRDRTIKRFLRSNERARDIKYEVRKADDTGQLRSKKGKREADLESFMAHCGQEEDPRLMRRLNRDHLTAFMSKSIRDILTLDAWAIETVGTRNGQELAGFHSVDAATVYLASEQGYMGDDKIIAVQVVNGLPVTAFTADELTYQIMNPRSDVLHHGYGYAPPEMIVKVITGYLNAMTYNLKGFDSNSIPKGLLNIYGDFDTQELTYFKQQWNSMIKGVNNAWALPVLTSPSKDSAATFTKVTQDFTDMYFAKWMVLLTSIVCGVYGMDPTEIYSESFHAGRSSLSGSDTAERLADARDTGLEPLMSFIEDVLTCDILQRASSTDYVFRFCGIQPSDKDWEHEVQKTVMTVRQLAEENGIDVVDEPWTEAPANPNLAGVYVQGMQAEMGLPGEEADQDMPGAPKPGVPSGGQEMLGIQDTSDLKSPTDQRKQNLTKKPLAGPEKAGRDKMQKSLTFRKASTGEVLVIS